MLDKNVNTNKRNEVPVEPVKVVVRLRGLNSIELGGEVSKFSVTSVGSRSWKVKDEKTCVQTTNTGESLPKKLGRTFFSFDKVFDEYASTKEVYDESSGELVRSFVKGVSGSIVAYGQTGSGKTYTMQGQGSIKEGADGKNGVIQMIARDVFLELAKFHLSAFLVRLSVVEIYQDEIRDLLSDSSQQKVSTRGLSVDTIEEFASDYSGMIDLLNIADSKRIKRKTDMNEMSSRSHMMYRITLEKKDLEMNNGEGKVEEAVQVSTLNILDLAGFDSNNKRGKHLNVAEKESKHINKSLMALSHVFADLARSRNGFINYRESTLTRVLQDDLKSQCKLAIICCISPSGLYTEQTRKTLEFGRYAKGLKTRPVVKDVLDSRSLIIKTLREYDRAKLEPGYPESECKAVEEQWNEIESSMLVGADIRILLEEERNAEDNLEKMDSPRNSFREAEKLTGGAGEVSDKPLANTEPIVVVFEKSGDSSQNKNKNKNEQVISQDLSITEMKILEMQEEWSSIKEAGSNNDKISGGNSVPVSSSLNKSPIHGPHEIPNEIQFSAAEQKILEIQDKWCSIKCAIGDDFPIQFSSDEASSNSGVVELHENGTHTSVEEDSIEGSVFEDDGEHPQRTEGCNIHSILNHHAIQGKENELNNVHNMISGVDSIAKYSIGGKKENYCVDESSQTHSENPDKNVKKYINEDVDDCGMILLSYSEDSEPVSIKEREEKECSKVSTDVEKEMLIDDCRDSNEQSNYISFLEKYTPADADYENAKNDEKLRILKASITQLNTENYELKNELEGRYKREKTQEDTIDSTRAENKRLIKQIGNLKGENLRILKEISMDSADSTNKVFDDCASSSLEVDDHDMSSFFSDSEASCEKANSSRENINADLSPNYQDSHDENEFIDLLRELTPDDYENAKNDERLTILRSCVIQIKKQIDGCNEMEKLQIETIGNLREQNKRLLGEIGDLKKENGSIMKKLLMENTSKSENKSLTLRVELLGRENESLKKDKFERADEIIDLKSRLSMFEKENLKFSNASICHKSEVSDLADQVKWLVIENESLRKDAYVAAECANEIIEIKSLIGGLGKDSLMDQSSKRGAHVSKIARRITEVERVLHEPKSSHASFSSQMLGDDQSQGHSVEPSFSIGSKESSEMSVFTTTESSVEDSMKSPSEDGTQERKPERYYAFGTIPEDTITDKENISAIGNFDDEESMEKKIFSQKQNSEEMLKQWENLSCTFKDYRQTVLGENKASQTAPQSY